MMGPPPVAVLFISRPWGGGDGTMLPALLHHALEMVELLHPEAHCYPYGYRQTISLSLSVGSLC